jgi:PTH2 family peptidyl-tRNA hydrolase
MRIKQVILIRKDLKMRRGKEIAQGAHAAMAFLTDQLRPQIRTDGANVAQIRLTDIETRWLTQGFAKVCLRVESEAELVAFHDQALAHGFTSKLIRDSGRTEFAGKPTLTACAIGPALSDELDQLTGALTPY